MKIISHIRLVFILFFLIASHYTNALGQNPEKLLLQIDREIYMSGEDILLNAFLLTREKINNSKVLYVEIFDTDNNIVEQKKLAINKGIASGCITLPEDISTQTYLLRAYTNYLKNFNPEIYPTKVFTVINPHVPVNAFEYGKIEDKHLIDSTDTRILVRQDTAHIAIDVTNVSKTGDFKLLLYSSDFDKIALMPFLSQQEFEISKQDIPEDLLYLALYDEDNNLLAVRPFYNWMKVNEFDIRLAKSNFKPREKVEFSIQNLDLFNSVSVSVVKKGSVDFNTISSNVLNNFNLLNTFLFENNSLVGQLKDTIDLYLEKAGFEMLKNGSFSKSVLEANVLNKKYKKELIGPSLTGNVYTELDTPLKDVRLFLSVYNGKKQFHSTKTDSMRRFSFSLYPKTYGNNRLIVRSEPNDSLTTKILLDYDFSNDFTKSSVHIDIDSTDKKLLEELYVNYQINKKDNSNETGFVNDTSFSMFGTPNFSIKIEDYINLPKVEEVFSEIVPYVSVRKKNGKPYLNVFNDQRGINYDSPLLLLDFIPIYNLEEFLKINPSNIYKIDVINRAYRLGDSNYYGIISITTKKNNFAEYPFPQDVSFLDFEGVSFKYDFSHVNYSVEEEKISHNPDFRTVLYWNTNLVTENISFFTSDHCSEYQILITGVDKYEHIVKSIHNIVVKQ